MSVSFDPRCDGYVNFRLVLKVRRKSEPLVLTVKADCFTMNASVHVETSTDGLREISPDHEDTLDFGKVSTSHKYTDARLELSHLNGKFSCLYFTLFVGGDFRTCCL